MIRVISISFLAFVWHAMHWFWDWVCEKAGFDGRKRDNKGKSKKRNNPPDGCNK